MRDINYVAVHCSATKAGMDIGVSEIRDWHVNKNGWSDIGYHYVIRRDGLVEFGRPVEQSGAHVKGHNYDSVGVCLVGGLDENGKAENNFTPKQMSSLWVIVSALKRSFPAAEVWGHRDFSPDLNHDGIITPNEWMKDCPCFDVKKWWKGTTF